MSREILAVSNQRKCKSNRPLRIWVVESHAPRFAITMLGKAATKREFAIRQRYWSEDLQTCEVTGQGKSEDNRLRWLESLYMFDAKKRLMQQEKS